MLQAPDQTNVLPNPCSETQRATIPSLLEEPAAKFWSFCLYHRLHVAPKLLLAYNHHFHHHPDVVAVVVGSSQSL